MTIIKRFASRRAALLCWGLLLACLWASPLAAQKAQPEAEVDFLELAALLLRDGHPDRAASALASVDLEAEGLDLALFHTVSGLIASQQNRHADARDGFLAAIAAGQSDPTIHLYLAQSQFALQAYRETIAALKDAGEAADALSSAWLMRAQSHWLLAEHELAWETLDQGSARFPENTQFLRRKVFYLVELGLYQAAVETGRAYLAVSDASTQDYVAIGNAMRKARQTDQALLFLEAARLREPANLDVLKLLAATYFDRKQYRSAGELMMQAAHIEPALQQEAAELFRRGGDLLRALSLNAGIADSQQKLKQRLAILLELKRYDQVAAMEESLLRARLLDDEDVRYALAFAYFQAGRHVEAERHLSLLKRSDLFRRATELRRNMQECAEEPWKCV